LARLGGALAFLFFGAFFIEHLEWFARPFSEWPPPYVLLLTGLHFLTLVALLAAWRWELAGGGAALVCGGVFLWFAAGAGFWKLAPIVALPATLWIATSLFDRGEKTADLATRPVAG
jgi:hypothetical protein